MSDTPHCRHQSSLQPSQTYLLHASGCDTAASRHPRGFCLPSRMQLHAALLHCRLNLRQELGTRPYPAQNCGRSLIHGPAASLVKERYHQNYTGCQAAASAATLQACQILQHPSLQHCVLAQGLAPSTAHGRQHQWWHGCVPRTLQQGHTCGGYPRMQHTADRLLRTWSRQPGRSPPLQRAPPRGGQRRPP